MCQCVCVCVGGESSVQGVCVKLMGLIKFMFMFWQ